jgi:hypothetical protein
VADRCRVLGTEDEVIRPLRRAHRCLILVLAVLLPIAIAFALGARQEFPIQQNWLFDEP